MQEPMGADVSYSNRTEAAIDGAVRSPHPDRSATGFTAVNGIHKRTASFRPSETSHPVVTSSETGAAFTTASEPNRYHSHGWRPDDSDVQHERQTETQQMNGKRKRSDELEVRVGEDAQTAVKGAVRDGSPTRRMTGLDSAIDLTSPENNNQPGAASPGNSTSSDADHVSSYQREKTPIERWEPPPKLRPETAARLAASLEKFQQQTQQESQQPRSFSPRHVSPPDEEPDDIDDSQMPSDDQYTGDILDPKRRKRNFSNRTKTGCHTCRRRKKKCDEGKPTCQNCDRSSYECEGYGPKPPSSKTSALIRTNIPLQSKNPMLPYNGRPNETPLPRVDEGRSYSHWGRIPPPSTQPVLPPPHPPSEPESSRQFVSVASADPRRPGTAEAWQKPSYPSHEPPNSAYPSNYPPPPVQPLYNPDQRQHQQQPPNHFQHGHGPVVHFPPSSARHHHPSHPLPMPLEPYGQHPSMGPYQHPGAPPPPQPQPLSSRGSVGTPASRRSDGFGMGFGGTQSQVEREKMLRGQPFLHFLDPVLLEDRRSCKAAVEEYNDAARIKCDKSAPQRGKLFLEILQPRKRSTREAKSPRDHPVPIPAGSLDDHSIVESPFRCDYGYNIHIGRDCIIESGCYFQDAADIYVGNRVMIGHDVKLVGLTVPLDAGARKGVHTNYIAGAIKIEDDCFIGAEVVVMPFVTIGRGAVVGAGSVVTKDVEENTVVGGNPAKLIRRIEGSNVGRHHSQQIQRQQEKMVDWMGRYADAGFTWHNSPRLA